MKHFWLFLLAIVQTCSVFGGDFEDDFVDLSKKKKRDPIFIHQGVHSIKKPYLGKGMKIPHWVFSGDTVVSNKQIRLTSDHPSLTGHLWNIVPNYSADWQLEFEFKVHGEAPRLYGDGFVFWYTKDYAEEGPIFGSKDHFSGMAVFFDTYSNHQGSHNHGHPYVSAMLNDGTKSYDHDADGTHTQIDGCQASFRGRDHPTKARISYIDKLLKIELDYRGYDTWQLCLQEDDVSLPTGYHFGFTAVTGGLSDNHDIISVEMKHVANTGGRKAGDGKGFKNIKPQTGRKIPDRAHVDPIPESMLAHRFFQFLQIIFYLAIVVAIGVVVVYVLRVKLKERDMKRF